MIKLIQMPSERSTDMKATRQEINNVIEALAKSNGFEVRTGCHGFKEFIAENLNFFTEAKSEWNMEERTVTSKVSMRASISRMGGNPTTDELFAVADEIRRGASMVESFNGFEMECTETFEELK